MCTSEREERCTLWRQERQQPEADTIMREEIGDTPIV
jgi:hypothetical protein